MCWKEFFCSRSQNKAPKPSIASATCLRTNVLLFRSNIFINICCFLFESRLDIACT